MIWFTADTHFNHARILELCQRPFNDVRDMNAYLIQRWNERVAPTDEVYVLGDFAFWYLTAQPLEQIFDRLKGFKHLVVGNHDEQNKKVLRLNWESQSQIAHVRYGEHRFIACHFPLERWWHMERGTIHLHGHCHGALQRYEPHRFDVGVDVAKIYAPHSAAELVNIAASQAFEPKDYHV